jgi:hypothetical protein
LHLLFAVILTDPARISTSYVERQNLTMRMGMRRFTRLTNAFSKKLDNHMAAIALHLLHYNFARPHKTLANPYPRTPAMAAGIADHVWTLKEIAALLDWVGMQGGLVFFGVAGLALIVFARWSVLVSLRPFFGERLAQLDRPENRRLRQVVNALRAGNIVVGLFFVVSAVLTLALE